MLMIVMPGLVPGIPIMWRCAWHDEMAGTSPAMTGAERRYFAGSVGDHSLIGEVFS